MLSSRRRGSNQREIQSMKAAGHLTRLVILLTVASLVHAENFAAPHLNIVPVPDKVTPLTGIFTLNNQTRIVAVDEESRIINGLLNEYLLNNQGFQMKIQPTAPNRGT